MGSAAADKLRQRARGLRGLATRVTSTSAPALRQRAGSDTWAGLVAEHCLADLTAIGRELQSAHDDLLAAALQLDRQATRIEAAAAVPAGAT